MAPRQPHNISLFRTLLLAGVAVVLLSARGIDVVEGFVLVRPLLLLGGKISSSSPSTSAARSLKLFDSKNTNSNTNADDESTSTTGGTTGGSSTIDGVRRGMLLSTSLLFPLSIPTTPSMAQSASLPVMTFNKEEELRSSSVSSVSSLSSSSSSLSSSSLPSDSITVPLTFTGQELLIYYRVDGSLFRAAVDTGSPFLMIPGSCGDNTKRKSGCYRNQGVPSGLSNTYELFDGFEGNVEWRMAPFSFVNATGSLLGPPLITLGVASESILQGPGGVFFGLIRDTDAWIRPSFLGQTSVTSFQLNLKQPNTMLGVDGGPSSPPPPPPRTLTLSTTPMIDRLISNNKNDYDYIRLTSDLRRKYGAPVNHYTARAEGIQVNNYTLAADDGKPIYIIIDTGVTGMVVSQELFDERYTMARQRRERNLWGKVDILLRTAQGKTITLSATKPLTTPFDPKATWKKFRRGHLIVLGLAFLDGNEITIDIDKKQMWIET